jgi:sugar phosphate isomerase/epimerase
MSCTRTGSFPIGFRRGGGWQKDTDALVAWTKDNDFECIDIRADVDDARRVVDAGLAVGSADLPDGRGMISPDAARRDEAVAKNAEFIRACRGLVANFFLVMLPEKPDLPRAENFGYMAASYGELVDALAEVDGRIVIEGWPGPGALCCTPETLRAFFGEVDSHTMGINYDPSHLIRMGIDPLRFLREFVGRVGHIHGKDTELLAERQYELGCEQPATFAEGVAFGGNHWRYTIPGHGQMRWSAAFRILADAGYDGRISVELEDANFNGSEEGEKRGLILARRFLEGC